jgi:hypothetical protein
VVPLRAGMAVEARYHGKVARSSHSGTSVLEETNIIDVSVSSCLQKALDAANLAARGAGVSEHCVRCPLAMVFSARESAPGSRLRFTQTTCILRLKQQSETPLIAQPACSACVRKRTLHVLSTRRCAGFQAPSPRRCRTAAPAASPTTTATGEGAAIGGGTAVRRCCAAAAAHGPLRRSSCLRGECLRSPRAAEAAAKQRRRSLVQPRTMSTAPSVHWCACPVSAGSSAAACADTL